jgi:hypothetical protein
VSPQAQQTKNHALVTLGASVIGTAVTLLGASLLLGDRLYVRQDSLRDLVTPINTQLAVLTYKVDELRTQAGTCPDCPRKESFR